MAILEWTSKNFKIALLVLAHYILKKYGNITSTEPPNITEAIAEVISKNRSSDEVGDWYTAERILEKIESITRNALNNSK